MSGRLVPDWIDGFMQYTANSEPPASYKLWTAISVLSAIMQRKVFLEWGPLTFYPNVYVVLVGPSGKCRKGTAMSFAEDFLSDLDGVHLAAESVTREALIKALSETTDNVEIAPGDLQFHSSLTIFAPELTVFLGYNNFQLMSDITDWYDCRKKWTYRTKNMGTDVIDGVYVSLFGATTPELIRTTLPLDAIGGGLTSRMIFVFEPNKGKTIPDPFLSDADMELRLQLKADLERIHCLRGTFNVTQKFVELWTEWYMAQEDNPPFNDHRFAGYVERRANHIMKLTMIVNVSHSSELVLTDKDLQKAIDILVFTEQKMPHTFSGVGKSDKADIITRIMSEVARRKTTTVSDLQKMFYFDADKRTLDEVIATLISMRFVKKIKIDDEPGLQYITQAETEAANQVDIPYSVGGKDESIQTDGSGDNQTD